MKTYGRKRSRSDGRSRDDLLPLSPPVSFPRRESAASPFIAPNGVATKADSTAPAGPATAAAATATATSSPSTAKTWVPCTPSTGSRGVSTADPTQVPLSLPPLSRKSSSQSSTLFAATPATRTRTSSEKKWNPEGGFSTANASELRGVRYRHRARRESFLSSVPVCSLGSTPAWSLGTSDQERGGACSSGGGGGDEGERVSLLGMGNARPWGELVGGSDVGKRRQGLGRAKHYRAATGKTRSNALTTAAGRSNGKEQTFLDFGQRSLGKRILCQRCDMLYVCGSEEDEARHAATCARVARGIEFAGWRQERVRARFPDDGGRIIEIRDGDPAAHRTKLHEVERLMDADMGFAPGARDGRSGDREGGPEKARGDCGGGSRGRKMSETAIRRTTNVFLYVRDRRVLGCVVAERIVSARRVVLDRQMGSMATAEKPSSKSELIVGNDANGVGTAGREEEKAATDAPSGGGGGGGGKGSLPAMALLQPTTAAVLNVRPGGINSGGIAVASADIEVSGNGESSSFESAAPSPAADGETSQDCAAEVASTSMAGVSLIAEAEALDTKPAVDKGRVPTLHFPSRDDEDDNDHDDDDRSVQPSQGSQSHIRDWSSGEFLDNKNSSSENRDLDNEPCFNTSNPHVEVIPGSPSSVLAPEDDPRNTTMVESSALAAAIAATPAATDGGRRTQCFPGVVPPGSRQEKQRGRTEYDGYGRPVSPVSADERWLSRHRVGQEEEKDRTPARCGVDAGAGTVSASEAETTGKVARKVRRRGLWAYFQSSTRKGGGEGDGDDQCQGARKLVVGAGETGKGMGVVPQMQSSSTTAAGIRSTADNGETRGAGHPGEQVGRGVRGSGGLGEASYDGSLSASPGCGSSQGGPNSFPRLNSGRKALKKQKPPSMGTHERPEATRMALADDGKQNQGELTPAAGGGTPAAVNDDGSHSGDGVGKRNTGGLRQQTLGRFFSPSPRRTSSTTAAATPPTTPTVSLPASTAAGYPEAIVGIAEYRSSQNVVQDENTSSGKTVQQHNENKKQLSTLGDSGRGGGGGGGMARAHPVPETTPSQQDGGHVLESGTRGVCMDGAALAEMQAAVEDCGVGGDGTMMDRVETGKRQVGALEGRGMAAVAEAAARERAFSMDSSSSSPGGYSSVGSRKRPREQEVLAPLPSSVLMMEDDDTPAVVGILQMWVHEQSRRQGVATRLIDTVRDKMVYGCPLRRDQIAFSQPTREGQAFATRYTKEKLLVY